ncbi:MAG: class 1 fructose-bisphosphatase [Methyloligellaceae bacterium]
MRAPITLDQHLENWAQDDGRAAVAKTVCALADAGQTISELVGRGPLAGSMGAIVGDNADGDTQKELDRLANDCVIAALNRAPVAYIASEELEDAVATGHEDAPLCVAIDPLDGSSNIETNVSVGTIFSVLPRVENTTDSICRQFFQPGSSQLAAGYLIYGPHTALVLTVGEGTHIFTLDRDDGAYKLTKAHVRVPDSTSEFAINMSNYRHWDDELRTYIDDCLAGADGARGKNFNTRWIASMVAECHRILRRGGIYLYPKDARPGYGEGRLRLVYEGNPIAFLMTEAGGSATTGHDPILDLVPTDIHQRVPLIFGSAAEVQVVRGYLDVMASVGMRSPLFGRRGLFRT